MMYFIVRHFLIIIEYVFKLIGTCEFFGDIVDDLIDL